MEQVPNTFPDLFWGYTIIWALLAFYLWTIARRLSRLERNDDQLSSSQ